MNNIGAKIRELRKKHGVSQDTLALILGVTKSTISKYELGHREISIDQLKTILDFFGVQYGLFLTELDNPEQEEWNNYVLDNAWSSLFAKNKSNYSELEMRLLTAFSQLNPDGQNKAIERVEELTEIPKYKKEPPQD